MGNKRGYSYLGGTMPVCSGKYEEMCLCEYETTTDVMRRIPYFLEEFYNVNRLHSALDYCPPNELEKLLVMQQNELKEFHQTLLTFFSQP